MVVQPKANKTNETTQLDMSMQNKIDADNQLEYAKNQIEELLKTANDASGAARSAWLGFLLVMAYLLVTIASTSHKDLLLNSPVTLPILNVELPLVSFFAYAPLLFLLLHLGLFIQHAVTAKKLNALNGALTAVPDSQLHAYESGIRGRLHYYAFCQYLCGAYMMNVNVHTTEKRTTATHRLLMRLILWCSFVILPGLTFLYFQIGFLSYHSTGITWWHRLLLLTDVSLLWIFWPIIRYDKPSWISCVWSYPLPWILWKVTATIAIVFVSVFVATLPDETADRWAASWWTEDRKGRKIFVPTAWLFEGHVSEEALRPDSWFSRNLVVVQENLVDDDNKFDHKEHSLSLRNRDLRYAVLQRTDLHRADLAYSKLEGASLTGARLEAADLSHAKLLAANFERANLQGTDLSSASLQGADISNASLQGANFFDAKLQGAKLKGSNLQGANFRSAKLQGANLSDTKLQGASFRFAQLQGASLNAAIAQSADFLKSNLRSADLDRAELRGADLRQAIVWNAWKPSRTALRDADLKGLRVDAPNAEEVRKLKEMLATLDDKRNRRKVTRRLTSLLNGSQNQTYQNWNQSWRKTQEQSASPSPKDLSAFLAQLICQGWRDGHAAEGIVRRASNSRSLGPQSYPFMLATELLKKDCYGANLLSDTAREKLRNLASSKSASWNGEPPRQWFLHSKKVR